MDSRSFRFLLLIVLLSSIPQFACLAVAAERIGTLTGDVRDRDTQEPLHGAAVSVSGTLYGATTDSSGKFVISSLPVGSITLKCTYIGYEPVIVTDIAVKSHGQLPLTIGMKISAVDGAEVEIRASTFASAIDEPVAVTSFNYEEIRRHPSSAGDISRILMALPSVANTNSVQSALIVRGGSPSENAFFVDGIPIPNINHFPSEGSSAGAFGLINVDGIEDVKFSPGGFPARLGDKLSSVTEINLREGNRESFVGQLDMNMAGIGGVIEGPLPEEKGSWMVSAHRSYFDLVMDLFDAGAGTSPFYSDYLTKVTMDLSSRNRLTILDVAGFDVERVDKQVSIDEKDDEYGRGNYDVNTCGISWRYLWGPHGYSVTTLSHNYTSWDSEWRWTNNDKIFNASESIEQQYTLRNNQHLLLNKKTTLDAGVETVIMRADYDNFWGEDLDAFGNLSPEFHSQQALTTSNVCGYASLQREWIPRLTVTTGLRANYNQYTRRGTISPRAQISYQADPQTTLNVSYGRVSQRLPLGLLTQNEAYKKLRDPFADHYIIGVSHLLTENTRLSLEVYDKEYRNLPLNPEQPSLFVIDQIGDLDVRQALLDDHGKAWTRGLELMLQKKLVENIYGVVSGSIYRARYQGYDGQWRDRIYDYRGTFTVEGGYRPNRNWEYSLRWVYAGGRPYTPYNVEESIARQKGIRDSLRVNAERIPDSHSLTLRVDKHFYFRASDLTCYFNVWNAYNRNNISYYLWNASENRKKAKYQWGLMAVIGIEYEF